jgi:O-acetylserine/cysteine efflux transporter
MWNSQVQWNGGKMVRCTKIYFDNGDATMKGLILLLCLIWGFNFVIMKEANTAFPPVLFAAFRFGLGTVVLFIIVYFKKIPFPSKQDLKWYIVCGLLQTTFFNIALQISLNHISAGLTSVLTYSMPFWLTLMAHVLIPHERLTVKKTIGLVTGILGLFIAMNVTLGGSLWSLLLALSSGLAWAISNIIIKLKLKHCNNIQFTAWQMGLGAVGLALFSLLFEHGTSHWGVMPVIYILFAGTIASAFAFVLWFYILSNTEASKASISLLLVPMVGIVSGCLVLHETLKIATTIGILFVLIGIWLVNSKSKSNSNSPSRKYTSSNVRS